MWLSFNRNTNKAFEKKITKSISLIWFVFICYRLHMCLKHVHLCNVQCAFLEIKSSLTVCFCTTNSNALKCQTFKLHVMHHTLHCTLTICNKLKHLNEVSRTLHLCTTIYFRIRQNCYALRDNWRYHFQFLWCFILINSFEKSNFLANKMNEGHSDIQTTKPICMQCRTFYSPSPFSNWRRPFPCDKHINYVNYEHITVVRSLLSWLLHLIHAIVRFCCIDARITTTSGDGCGNS